MKLATTNILKSLYSNNDNLIKLSDKQIKRIQSQILLIADDIIGICEENNISYHLTGGSALGAVRHSGFIPWDDDIDIDVERKDYEKLLNIIKDKYSDKYYVQYPKAPSKLSTTITRIILKDGIFIRNLFEISDEFCRPALDIITIENTFNNKILRYIHGIVSLMLGLIVSCRRFAEYGKQYLEMAKGNKEAIKVFKTKIIIGKIFSFLSLRRWNIIFNGWNAICKNTNSKYVTVAGGRKHFFGELYERKDFCEYAYMEFEGRKWRVPKEYDKYLKKMYGDYMKIPDEKDREQHIVFEIDLGEEND